MGVEYFFKLDGKTKEEKINKFRNSTKRIFTEHMITEYVNSINNNGTPNIEKGSKIKKGYEFLIKSNYIFGGIIILIIILSLIEYLIVIKVIW